MAKIRMIRAGYTMDRATFRRLLFRGHGRAPLYLRRRPTDRFDDVIVEACTTDTRLNWTCDDGRAPYLIEAVEYVPRSAELLPLIWARLLASEPGSDQSQMLEIAGLCAKRSLAEARKVLYKVFERNCLCGSIDGAEEVVKCFGSDGYRHVLATIGRSTGALAEDWVYWGLHYEAREELGEAEADRLLAQSKEGTARLAAVAEAVARNDARKPAKPVRRERVPAYESLKDGSAGESKPRYWHWGAQLSPGSALTAAMDLELASDDQVIFRLLDLFHWRAFPLSPVVLIRLTGHNSDKIRRAAFTALSNVRDPEARAFALASLASRKSARAGMWVLESNYESGDALLIEQALHSIRNPDDLDAYGISVFQIAEKAERPELAGVFRAIYERSSCALCRGRAVEQLHKIGGVTPRLIEECLYDSESQTRDLAAKLSAGPTR